MPIHNPSTCIFKLMRHTQLESCNLEYCHAGDVIGCPLVLAWMGLVQKRAMRYRFDLQ
jgi:hypothetical protein